MQQELDSGTNVLVTVGGWLVAILIALFTFIAQWRKGGVDETAVVLGKWKELVEAHEKQLSSLHSEIGELRKRVAELEQDVTARDKIIEELRKELEGERRQREQQALSFAEQLKRLGHNNPPEVGHGQNK